MTRAAVLATLAGAAVISMWIGLPAQSPNAADLPTLTYVTTAHQLGVVGYRDPVGAISPDGSMLAYAAGRFIYVVPIGGGTPLPLRPAEGQVRHLLWTTDVHLAVEDVTPAGRWWLYHIEKQSRDRLWSLDSNLALRQLSCVDGGGCVGFQYTSNGAELVSHDGDTETATRVAGRASWPVRRRNGTTVCIVNARLTSPCGGAAVKLDVERDVYGPIAFAPAGNIVYFSSPNNRGMVELLAADLATGRTRLLSNFSRDAYAPSVARDGTVVFKTQSYRTHLADVAFEGGPPRQLTTFQSETPSYHPTKPLIAFTYGTWRRVIDDAKYPDIAQEIGTIDLGAPPPFLPWSRPTNVLEDSDSEDQAMTWSPNGKWIAFHTHKEISDDVWLRPADGSQPGKRITFLGRGAEVGWPRWSPDGRTVLLNGARKSDGESVLYAIGVNQDSGAVTSELREIKVEGITAEMGHAEWMPNSTTVIAIAKEGPGRHVIFTVPAANGRATVVHRVETEHDFPGLGVSANGRFVAFVAPANDGFFQIFIKAIDGKTPPVQLTTDRSHKTQPTFSPDGSRVAFTVWSYEASFWSFKER